MRNGSAVPHTMCNTSFFLVAALISLLSACTAERHVSVGRDHLCFIAGGLANRSIACYTTDAAAASGTAGNADPKISFLTDNSGFQSVSVGDSFTCGLRMDGSIECSGSVSRLDGGPFIDIAAGSAHICALHTDGTVACGGDAITSGGASVPPTTLPPLRALSCAGRYCLAISRAGAILAWGDAASPVLSGFLPSGNTWVEVAAGERHAIAINATGAALAWGDSVGAAGAMAVPTTTPALPPSYQPPPYYDDYEQMTAGTDISCGLIGESVKAPRLLTCWGADSSDSGVTGINGTALAAGAPADPAGSTVWEVSCGHGICAAIDGEGMLQMWTATAAAAGAGTGAGGASSALLPSPGLAAALEAFNVPSFPVSPCGAVPATVSADDSLLVFRTLSAGRVIGAGNAPVSIYADGECTWGHIEAPVRIMALPGTDPRIGSGSGPLATVGGGIVSGSGLSINRPIALYLPHLF